MPAAITKKNLVVTTDDRERSNRANLARAKTRARRSGTVGFIIQSPMYGQPEADKLKDDWVNVHRHNVASDDNLLGYVIEEGGKIPLVLGEGFTTNRVWAEWVKDYWGPSGYKVIEVREDGDFGQLSNAHLKAKAIMAGTYKPSDEDDEEDTEDDEDATEEEDFPDAPRIQV